MNYETGIETIEILTILSAISRQLGHQVDHFQCRHGTIDALVADAALGLVLAGGGGLAAGAGDGLFERVAGQHAEEHGQSVVDADLAQGRAHGPVDVLVVGGFAADDRPQAEDRHVAAAGRQAVGHGGDLERAGRPGDVDVVVGHAVGDERLHRAFQKTRGNRFVEPRHHDGEAALGGGDGSLKCVGHGSEEK